MLLSPPFLPPRAELDESGWLDLAMAPSDDGAFPVSHDFAWHGGKHLVAPVGDSGVGLPVRAIADGTVVYVRQRTEADSPDEPLNYGAGYTSDAVVVIKHTTDIGLNAQGQPVAVTFYSVYMHLHSIRATVMRNRPIYRKDEIGQAGNIYGEPNRLHFEICCDDENLALLVGRKSGDLKMHSDGRSDVLFGDLYFAIPAGTLVSSQKPLSNSPQAAIQPPTPAARRGQPPPSTPPIQTLHPAYATVDDLFVGLRYGGGTGPLSQRGDAIVTTYRMNGTVEGQPLREPQAEYSLYTTSTHISESYPATGRPTPAAVYELLRFGRVIGPDALTPADVPHWRQINYPGGTGWVNLNANGVRKFSDADFPHWRGWTLVSDDNTPDSHCNSVSIADIVYGQGATRIQTSKQNAAAQLGNSEVRRRLSRTVCKFPSEWDASTIDSRWNWLMVVSDEHPESLSEDDYVRFNEHITALCFPSPELFRAQWCFDPRQFIEHFRGCGWLAAPEFAQCFPSKQLHLPGTTFQPATKPWNNVIATATNWINHFNIANRRYGVSASKQRLVHYFSHVIPETGFLNLVKEGDNASGSYLRGQKYWPYYGRGLIQLT